VLADVKTESGPLTLIEHAKLHQVKWKNKEAAMTGVPIICHKINSWARSKSRKSRNVLKWIRG